MANWKMSKPIILAHLTHSEFEGVLASPLAIANLLNI
jgi:hypothetical protein